ncbi:unnamed protein product [Spodoptera exigua]|nr:unnamed protein product [Spodoptera exigua]
MGLWGKAAKALVIVVIIQIACRHCMPRTPRKSALLNNLNPAKNNPLSTPFAPARTDKTSKQTTGKTIQNARISKNLFQKESIFKKHNFPENDFPLDTSRRDPFHLTKKINTNYQANRPKANDLRSNTQSSIINELKKERKMKRKLQSNAQLNYDINQPTKETIPTTFSSGSTNNLLDPKAFPDIQYPLNTMETWEPMYWNSFSLAPPTPFDGLQTPRYKTPINEIEKNPLTTMTKTKARQFLKTYDKLKDENKRTSTDNSKRSNVGQSGLNFKKTAASEQVSEDFIAASLLEKVPKNSPSINITVESPSREPPSSDTPDTCSIEDNPVYEGVTKINRSESKINDKKALKHTKKILLAEALAAIEEILNSDETNSSESVENICMSPELAKETYTTINETTSTTAKADYVEIAGDIGNNVQSTNASGKATIVEPLEEKLYEMPVCIPQNNISSLLEETNIENSTIIENILIPTTSAPEEMVFTNRPNQTLTNHAAPGPTSIIIIPINNNAVGQPQSHMIDTTGNTPIIVYIPNTQSSDVPSQTEFCQQNISQASFNKTVPSNEHNNDLSNLAPLLNDNPASTALVSELPNDTSTNESSLPVCEPLPINSMCYINESSQSSIKEKPFLNNSTHQSVIDMTPFTNSTSNEKSLHNDDSTDICDDIKIEKTLPQMLDSEHPIFDFPGSYTTSLSHGPYNNIIHNELPIVPREIDSGEQFVNTSSEHQFITEEKNATSDYLHKGAELDHHTVNPEVFIPGSDLFSRDLPWAISDGFIAKSSNSPIYAEITKPKTPKESITVSLPPVDELKTSLSISENLDTLMKPVERILPETVSEAHTTSIPIELSLSSGSPTAKSYDKRIIIDVKLVPIEDSNDDYHSTKTVQDTLLLIPDKPIIKNQKPIDLLISDEASETFVPIEILNEEKLKTFPSTPYLQTNNNLLSSVEMEPPSLLESKPYLTNNLVAPISNAVLSHENVDVTTNDMNDLPLKMGMLLPDFYELPKEEPVSHESVNFNAAADLDMSKNSMPMQFFDHSSLKHPSNKFEISFPADVLKDTDKSDEIPRIPVTQIALSVPQHESALEAIKPPVTKITSVKDEIEQVTDKINDISLSTAKTAQNSSTIDDSSIYISPENKNTKFLTLPENRSSVLKDIFQIDMAVKDQLPTDVSSLTSKLLITKALLDNVLADINNTYNTGALSPSIPLSSSLNITHVATESPASETPSKQNNFIECDSNSSLSSIQIFSNILNNNKEGSSNTLSNSDTVRNADDDNNTTNTGSDLQISTISEAIPFIVTSDVPGTHDLPKLTDTIVNAPFSRISNDLSLKSAVPDRSSLDEKLSNSQEFDDKSNPILQAENPDLHSQSNNPISKTKDDVPAITVTKDLLESVLLDIFTKRLSFPLTQISPEATPAELEIKPHFQEFSETKKGWVQSSMLLNKLEDTEPLIKTVDKTDSDISVAFNKPTENHETFINGSSELSLLGVNISQDKVLKEKTAKNLDILKTGKNKSLEKTTFDDPNTNTTSNNSLNSSKKSFSDDSKEETPVVDIAIPADPTPSQRFDDQQDFKYNSTAEDLTDKVSSAENENKSTISNSNTPKYNIDSSKKNTLSSSSSFSEITVTKKLLESILTDVLRKEFLLSRAQSDPDISSSIFNNSPYDKETSIPNSLSETYPKENNNLYNFNASQVDGPADFTDEVPCFNISTDQSYIREDEEIHNKDNDSHVVQFSNKKSMSVKENIPNDNEEKNKLSNTIEPLPENVLTNISDDIILPSVVEPDTSTFIAKLDIPDKSSTPLEHVSENFPKTQTNTYHGSAINVPNPEKIEINENETVPIDEIIISIPNEDILSPNSPSELRISKALLENVLRDMFSKGLLPIENILREEIVASDDNVANESPPQVLQVFSNETLINYSNVNLAVSKDTENNWPMEEYDKTLNITNSNITIDHINVSTFEEEDINDYDPNLENYGNGMLVAEDTKLDSNKDINVNDIPPSEQKMYSPSKFAITKVLLENILTDIFAKGLSLPKVEPSSETSSATLDKTLYYTETPKSDISNETPVIQLEEATLDITPVANIYNNSALIENAYETLHIPSDKIVVDKQNINRTELNELNAEVIHNGQNQNDNLASLDFNDDLSPLNEDIHEPKIVPITSRSTLDKTLYSIDTTLPNEQTKLEHIGAIFEIPAEKSILSDVDIHSVLEQTLDETTPEDFNSRAHSEESNEEEMLENISEDMSDETEEVTSLANTSDDLSLKENILDVIEEITGSPAQRSKRVLYSKLPSTKALLEKVLFDITDGGILG